MSHDTQHPLQALLKSSAIGRALECVVRMAIQECDRCGERAASATDSGRAVERLQPDGASATPISTKQPP
jgi:hypothetical protein